MTTLSSVHLCFVKFSQQTVIESTYVTALPGRYTDWVAGSSTDRAMRAYLSSKISGQNLGATRAATQWFQGVKLTTHFPLVQNLGMTRAIPLLLPYLFMVFTVAQFRLPTRRYSLK